MPCLLLRSGRHLQFAVFGVPLPAALRSQGALGQAKAALTPIESAQQEQPATNVDSSTVSSALPAGLSSRAASAAQQEDKDATSISAAPTATRNAPALPLPAPSPGVPKLTIVYHHGWPSCRQEASALHEHAYRLGVRILAVNRPGVGQSSRDPGMTFHSMAGDVDQLLDTLGVERAVMMGASGGGPWACACAHYLPDRTAGIALVASMTHTRRVPHLLQGMATSNRLGYLLINHAPWLGSVLAGALDTALTWMVRPVAALWSSLVLEPIRSLLAPSSFAAPVVSFARTMTLRILSFLAPAGVPSTAAAPQTAADVGPTGRPVVSAAGAAHTAEHAAASNMAEPAASAALANTKPAAGEVSSQPPPQLPWYARSAASAAAWAFGFAGVDGVAILEYMYQQRQGKAEQGEKDASTAAGTRSVLPPVPDPEETGSPSEILEQGALGVWQDMRLTSEPWSLSLRTIQAQVHIWQGGADINVTPAMAKHLHEELPNSRLQLIPGEGHISLALRHGPQMLDTLVREHAIDRW